MHAVEIREDKLINGTFAQQELMLFTLFECPYEVWLKKQPRKQPFNIQEPTVLLIRGFPRPAAI